MKLEITLAPSGDFRLIIPGNAERTLDISANATGASFLKRILHDAMSGKRDQRGYIAEFPTQAIIDAWALSASVRREVERKEQLEADLGVSLDSLELDI